MINTEKFQAEIQKNMQAMVNEHKKLIRENSDLKKQILELEKKLSTNNVTKSNKDAVIIFAVDISGSMNEWCRGKGKEYADKLHITLKNMYNNVHTRFIHHHTEAVVVSKDEFLVEKVSGGTICSSAYRLINKELEDFDYQNENIDVFVVHISDGDNLTSDNARAFNLINKILNKVTKMYYVETNQYDRFSTLLRGFKQSHDLMANKKFNYGVIKGSNDVDVLINDFTYNL